MRYNPEATRWMALVRPAPCLSTRARAFGSMRVRTRVSFRREKRACEKLEFTLEEPFEQFLARAGRLPLPPYVHNESDAAQERYQTVFAREPGSVAAPTASLHFTNELLQHIAAGGVTITELTLDVGLGTFRPMSGSRLEDHTMHAERYAIEPATIAAIQRARERGGRVIAAGTTVVRALEGNVATHGRLVAGEGETALFVKPGFAFAVVDAMITNFHLRSQRCSCW